MYIEKFFTVDLSEENALIAKKEISKRNLRHGSNPDIENGSIRLHIAERPIAIDYIELCRTSSIAVSPEMQILHDSFDFWLVKYVVGIMDNSHSSNVIDFGFKTKYDKNVSIQSMLPETKYVKKAVTGGFTTDVALAANGEADFENTKIDISPISIDIGAGVKFGISGHVGIHVSVPTLTPKIVSIGQNACYGEWTISREDKILAGDQVFIQVLLTDKFLEKIRMETQVYCTIRKLSVINSRRESDWMTLDIPLVKTHPSKI